VIRRRHGTSSFNHGVIHDRSEPQSAGASNSGLRAAARVFFGPPTEAFSRVAASRPTADLTWGEKVPAMILVGALLFIGFWPKSFSTAVNQALAVPPAAAESR
jgi:NADH:ubiquinone oxidoreductase subunit 4 (subunit M)